MAGTIELNEVINLTMDAVRGILNFDIGSFHLVEGERVRMVYTQGFKVEGEFVQEVSGPGVIPEAIRTRKSQLVPDVRKSSLYMRGLLPAKEARVSEMTVPVLVDGECIAAINVEGRTVGAFKQGDVELLEVLASHVASALKRIRAVETEKSSKQALKSLNRVLKSSNEELFAVNEKLRKSEWDLQAFNEELQASEEELRTSNEELSTSNEELSATEEELRVANEIQQEYANKLEVMVEQRTAKLKESEQRLRGFMDSTEDGFAIFDSELRLIDVNRVGLELILMGNPPGTTRESLTGKRYSEIFPGVEKSERYAAMERVLKMREPIQWEGVSWVSPDIWHSNTAFPVGSGIGVISRNITKQRRLQLELQRSEVISAVEQMGATVAHDLRGPLGQIVQSVNLIKQDPALTPRMLKLVEENAVRSLKMISDWRSSTREIVPQPVKTDLGVLVNSVIVGTTIPTNVDIHASIEDGLESILVDPDITHRVLDNLVKNAVEAMPQGGNLLIAAKIQGNKVEIRVSDTGVGISEELRGRIFSPLFTTKAGGMGLGLTYCRRAVEAQGGSLDFESKVGFGTTFIMTLPRGKQNIK
jgi:PAS domain S-box-containing protein